MRSLCAPRNCPPSLFEIHSCLTSLFDQSLLLNLEPSTCGVAGISLLDSHKRGVDRSSAMKLLVTIKAGEDTQEIVLPVGHGTNTFKWLADAAAYRYVRTQKTHTLPRSSNLLPRDVYNEDCPFFHPDDKIKDHVNDGNRITVELYTELPLDDYGIPKLSHWALIAFRHEESQQERRQKCIEEKTQEVIAFNDERERQAKQKQLEIERPKISEMRKIMADQLISDAEIERTVNEEWSQIKDSGVLVHIGEHGLGLWWVILLPFY